MGAKGLWSELFAIADKNVASRPYFADFVAIVRDTCAAQLDGIALLPEAA